MIAVYLLFLLWLVALAGYGKYGKTPLAGYLGKQRKQFMAVGACGILAAGLWISGRFGSSLVDGHMILRNENGMGSKQLELRAETQERGEEITVEITERTYTQEELEELLDTFLPQLDRAVLGENVSFDRIEHSLQLVSGLDGYPFQVEWESGDYEWIDSQGNVNNEELEQERIVPLRALIMYGDYRLDYNFSVVVCPKTLTAEDNFVKNLRDRIKEEDDYVILPDEIEGQAVTWEEKKKDSSVGIFLLGIAAAVLMSAGEKWEQHQEETEKKKKLMQEYPEIVSKLTLLLGAGLTLQGGIDRLTEDYVRRKEKTGKVSFACEELLIVRHEIESGVSETAAYANLGYRCGLPDYKKLSTLLVRSLKKGAGNLLLQLENETKNAQEDKKAAARRKGEEASTKLLLPMMLMLLIVMLLIIIPAFGGFSLT